MHTTLFILESIGTIAFAISGALAAIEKNMDLLGIVMMGVITAVGGGALRDITLGITPPAVFIHPVYLITALISSMVLILALSFFKNHDSANRMIPKSVLNLVISVSDSIGLGIFTTSGVGVAIAVGHGDNFFLVLFVGAITGVGGGVLRDVFTMRIPGVFVKHVYAVSSLVGATLLFFLYDRIDTSVAMWCSTIVIICIRFISIRYRLSLPKMNATRHS